MLAWIRSLFPRQTSPEEAEKIIMIMFWSLPSHIKERITIRCMAACRKLDSQQHMHLVKRYQPPTRKPAGG
jgi:hypothetical protein